MHVYLDTQIYGYNIIWRTQGVFLQIRHTHSVLFLSVKWHIWTSVPGKIPPSLQKDCKLFHCPKSLLLRIVGFRLIQNVLSLMESSEDRSLLKQRSRLSPMEGSWTRAAFTLCDTFDFCRAIKKLELLFSNWNFPFSAASWRHVLKCLTGLAMHPSRAVLAGRVQAPTEIQTTMGDVIRSNTKPILVNHPSHPH